MQKVLVSGGSGFVGRHLIRTLLIAYPDVEITSLSRSEGTVSVLLTECPSHRVRLELTDIRDIGSLRCAMKDIDTVIHLAAMKRVDLAEQKCREAATINVLGTLNMLEVFHGDTFILMSTDKAVEPVNCYGATKLVAEKLVMERAAAASGQRFMVVRSGNILESTGSVLDIWKHQVELNNEITVTDPEMKRFYVSAEGVTRLYMAVLEHGQNGKIYYTPRGDPVVLRDMIREALRLYGNEHTRVKYIGLRPGERMYEKMRLDTEVNTIAGLEDMVREMESSPMSVSETSPVSVS